MYMIELPRTPEEITVWRLEYVDSNILYCAFLYSQLPLLSEATIRRYLEEWLGSIVHLEGAVTATLVLGHMCPNALYRVAVAGVTIMAIDKAQLYRIFQRV
jgi:hypothetical protein